MAEDPRVAQALAVLAAAQDAGASEQRRLAAQMQEEARARQRGWQEAPAAADPLPRQLKAGEPRASASVAAALSAAGRPLEARVFGLGVLQALVRLRWRAFAQAEREALATLALERLREVGGAEGEPWAIKVKTAALLAEAVRQDGPGLWAWLCPQLLAGAAAGAGHCEAACLVLRTLAEDVTVYNDDLEGGRMRQLLSALTASLPDVLTGLYAALQAHVPPALSPPGALGAPARRAARAAAAAALAAAAAHAEWAPFAALARSGLLDALQQLLPAPPFRLAAADALRAVAARRITEAEEEKEACRAAMAGVTLALARAAAALAAAPAPDPLSEEDDAEARGAFAARLCDALATALPGHMPQPAAQRAEAMAGLLTLTRDARVRVSAPAWVAWQALLRTAGAPAAGGAAQPAAQPPKPPPAEAAALELPPGLLRALAEASAERLAAGGGLAGGCDNYTPPAARRWLEEFDSAEELRECWLLLRSHAMSVARMAAFLDPGQLAAVAAARVQAAAAAAAAELPSEASAAAAAAGLEGAFSFAEGAVAGCSDSQLAPGGAAAAGAEAALSALLALPPQRPPGVALQAARGLEALGRLGCARPDAATATLSQLFRMLEALPLDAGGGEGGGGREPPAVARQRCCTAVLGVAAAAGPSLRPHLASLAEALGRLTLRGAERGTLAEALLTVSQAPGGDGGQEMLGWLLSPVAARWAAPGGAPEAALAPQRVASPAGPHWALFDDVQLLERCLRRACLAAAAAAAAAAADSLGGSAQAVAGQPSVAQLAAARGASSAAAAGALRAAAAHAAAAAPHLLRVASALHALWTPGGRAALAAAGGPAFLRCLDMSPEEAALAVGGGGGGGGGSPPDAPGAPPRAGTPPPPQPPADPAASAARSFLRGVRDAVYGTLALALPGLPASGAPGSPAPLPPGDLYAAEGLPAALAAALLGQLDSMELRHARQLTKTLLQPLLCRAPPPLRAAWAREILPRLLPHMGRRLAGDWAAWAAAQPAAGAPPPPAAEGAQAEVVAERQLREATRAHAALLQALCCALEPAQPAWADLEEECAALRPAHAACCAMLALPDGDAAARASAVLRHLALCAAEGRARALPPASEAWAEAMGALLAALQLPGNAPHAPELLALARELALRLGGAATAAPVARLLQQLPRGAGGAEAGWAAVEAELRGMRSEREQRQRLRAFLLAAAGGSLAAFAADGSGKPAASSVTVTRLGPPAARRSRGGAGFGSGGGEGGALGLASFGAA